MKEVSSYAKSLLISGESQHLIATEGRMAASQKSLSAKIDTPSMQDWFNLIGRHSELPASAIRDLQDVGFVVIPGPVAHDRLAQLATAYDSAVASASSDDLRFGSTTTRVRDFVNRGSEFDELYVFQPILEACCRVIGQPFRLSTMHARTVRARMPAQELHVDFERDINGWTMVGFIFMVDEFRSDNGATRFIPGSHNWSTVPDKLQDSSQPVYENQVLACGPAGSLIVFNGSVWHGHAANSSDTPRRSIQGAYIRREASSGENLPERMRPDTLARISSLAKYVLAVG